MLFFNLNTYVNPIPPGEIGLKAFFSETMLCKGGKMCQLSEGHNKIAPSKKWEGGGE